MFKQLLCVSLFLFSLLKAQDFTNVLILSNSEIFNENVISDFASIPDLNISGISITDSIPELVHLLSFDVVLLGGDPYDGISNTYQVGNILHDFVLAGGYLVLSDVYWNWRNSSENQTSWGALETIDPLLGWRVLWGPASIDSSTVVEHFLTTDIDTIEIYYFGGPDSVREDATVLAWWDNGNPLIAFNNPLGWITAVNFLAVDSYYYYDKVANNYNEFWNNVLKWKRTIIGNPEISVSPGSFNQTLAFEDSSSTTLNISNIGQDILTYGVNLNFGAEGTLKSSQVKERHFKNLITSKEKVQTNISNAQRRGIGEGENSNKTFALDKTTFAEGDWQTRNPMVHARAQAGIEAHPNGNIYVFGGYSQNLEIYNIATDQWSGGESLPFDVRGIATGIGNNGYIYAFDPWEEDTVSYKYHPDSGIWQATNSIVPVWEPGFTRGSDGLIYIFGGENSQEDYAASDIVQIYDTAVDSVRFGAPMPTARIQLGAAEFGGLIYTFGGRYGDNDTLTGVVEVYDPETDTWSSADSMPTPRNQFAIAVGADNKIYTIGGKDNYGNDDGPFFDIVEIYDPATDTWEEGPSLPFAMGEIRATTYNGVIYVAGGSNGTIFNHLLALTTCGTWLNLSSTSGQVASGGSDIININFNSRGLDEGIYYSSINISSNDREHLLTRIPVTLTVDSLTTSIEVSNNLFAREFNLSQNYPNPFNPLTTIKYSIPVASKVLLKIYNVLGDEVVSLVNEYQQKGIYTLQWDAQKFSSGVYFYKLQTELGTRVKKLVLLK